MYRLIRALGCVDHLEIVCPGVEAFLSRCARQNIPFWNVKKHDAVTLTLSAPDRETRAIRDLCRRCGGQMRILRRTGAGARVRSLRRRGALLAGLLLFCALVRIASLHIWQMEVLGNESVSDARILEELKDLGVGIGTFTFAVDSEALSRGMLTRIPELSWFAVNVAGSKAQVLVRERVSKPELYDPAEPKMVVAEKSGVIERIITLAGTKRLDRGSTVLAGEVIVSGVVEPLPGGRELVHASAQVYARTWYELSAEMPLQTVTKRSTGRKKTRYGLIVAGKRINFSPSSGIAWPCYDKIIVEEPLRLTDSSVLPVTLCREIYTEYEPVQASVDEAAARQMLMRDLTDRLTGLTDGAEIRTLDWQEQSAGGLLRVTLRAECLEQIAGERDMTPEEKSIAEAGTENE